MNCDPLPNTGLDAPVLLVLTVAMVCLLLGAGLLLRAKRSPGQAGAALLLVIFAVGTGVLLTTPTSTAFADCTQPGQTTTEPAPTTDPDNSLTITQTSTMDNLAPGAEPADITGLVVNNGPDDTFITAITVEIVGVVRRPGSAAGECDGTDYVLVDPRMPVNEALEPYGDSTVFTGAAIGFNNKSSNQDACQGATVQLRYRTSD